MAKLKMGMAILFTLHTVLAQRCPDVQNFDTSGYMKTRLTSISNGNYTIQALVTLAVGANCDRVMKDGLVRTYAIRYAIDKANKNKALTRYAKLGLQLDDVCRSLPVTMARGIEVVAQHRPNSVCRYDFLHCNASSKQIVNIKQASAVIGTGMSFTSIPLSSLMSLYYIPQVSYAASSRLLSKKNLYKSFFRTIPSDTKQVSVMLDIFEKFNWNYVFAIGSDDDYGKLGVSDLKREAIKRNVCIPYDEYIPYQSLKTAERVNEVVTKIKKEERAKVVVLFCYVRNLGDLILKEAEKQGIKRIWLTSEAWNPSAANLDINLQNQTVGLLSVSLKTYPMHSFLNYIENKIKTDFKCNMWFQRYLKDEYHCNVSTISEDKETLHGVNTASNADNCTVKISNIMKKLSNLPGNVDRIIDAATSIAHAISAVLEKLCSDHTCNIPKLPMKQITDEMFKVSFTNEQGQHISFNNVGDPQYAYYTIENLQLNGTKYQFFPVGNWSQQRGKGKELLLDETIITWPVGWFDQPKQSKQRPRIPYSRCSDNCKPGQEVVGKDERVGKSSCCWACQNCTGNNHTDTEMATKCKECGKYSHTIDHTRCIKTPLLWLEIQDPASIAITIISTLGLIIMAFVIIVLVRLRHLILPNEKAPHLISLSCLLTIVTFAYGPLHITEPTHLLCQTRNSIFFMLLMIYSAILLIKSNVMTKYLFTQAEKSLRGNLLSAQLLFLFMLFLLELVSVVVWLYIDKVQVQEFRQPGVYEIWLQCEVTFTAARLVSTFIPCIVLIIATFCAFRERNLEHSFYEPKFLSFTCIALCIIIVAFLPTFKYVVGVYKAIVMAFTMDVFGYTFMACLVLPKVYVAIMRHKRGFGKFSVKPGTATKQKQKEIVQESSVSEQQTTTSSVESSQANNHGLSDDSLEKSDKTHAKTTINHCPDIHFVEQDESSKDVTINEDSISYSNATYQQGSVDFTESVGDDIESVPPAVSDTDSASLVFEKPENENTKF